MARFRALLFLLATLRIAAAADAPESLTRNPDFDKYEGGFVADWIPSKAGAIQVREEDGRRFLRWPAQKGESPLQVRQTLTGLDLSKGQKLRLRCDYRAGSADALVKVTVRDAQKKLLVRETFRPDSTGTWLEQTAEVTLPAATDGLEIRVSAGAPDTPVDLARIAVERVPDAASELVLFSLFRPHVSLEGGPEQPGWAGLQKAVDFLVVGSDDPAPDATTCRSAYNDEAVFFLVEMSGSLPETPETVEVWLGPEGRTGRHFQFLIQRDGTLKCYVRSPGRVQPVTLDAQATVTPRTDGWIAALRIPFAAMQTGRPADNARWSFNVCRQVTGGDRAVRLSSWAAVAAFDQTRHFGELAFYSRAEVEADIAYWKNNDNDPLLRRTEVSGQDIHARARAQSAPASFWTYDLFSVDRAATEAWGCRGLTDAATAKRRGWKRSAEADYPAFFHAADSLNLAILALSNAHLALEQTKRAAFHASALDISLSTATQTTLQSLDDEANTLDQKLDHAFSLYHAAFHNNWNPNGLRDLNTDALSRAIQDFQDRTARALAEIQAAARKKIPWTARPTIWDATDDFRNANGAPERFWFTACRLYGGEPAARYFGPFRSWNIGWPYLIAQRNEKGAFSLPYADTALDRLVSPDQKINYQTGFGLVSYQAPTSPWLEKHIAADPNILASSQDHLPIPKERIGALDAFMRRGVNISHPTVRKYARDYLGHVVGTINSKRPVDFVITGWEDRMELRLRIDGKLYTRQRGYDSVSRKAFQDFLKERYGTITNLRKKCGVSGYEDFSDIQPPAGRYLAHDPKPTGLTYEWSRWQRASHFDWNNHLRSAVKAAAPEVPVMTNSSHLLMEGTAWAAISHHAADIVSFHSNPTNEDAMFAYLSSLTRDRELPLASFENYVMMYSRLEGDDERLAARGMRRYFFDLIARDVRMVTFWLGYMAHDTSYIAAYGGANFRIDDDQTLLRWPSTEIALFMRQATALERPLVKSTPARGRIAVLIPDSTFLQTQYLQGDKPGTSMEPFIYLQNSVLSEASLPAEYLHEDQLADGNADLTAFEALIVVDAPFLRSEALAKIRDWTSLPGKTLFVSGSLGTFNEFGQPLPQEASPLRTAFPKRPTSKNQTAPPARWLESALFAQGTVTRLTENLDAFLANPKAVKALQEALAHAITRAVTVSEPKIRVQLRRGSNGETYILASNRDVRAPREFTVTVSGDFASVFDLGIPGWFPVEATRHEDQTKFSTRLAPGDWTLFKLRPSASKSND